MIACLYYIITIIQAIIPIPIKYNPYSIIVNKQYNVIWTTTWSSDCLTWKILDIKITNNSWDKQYIFFPDKTWDDNTYSD